ncbi:hypothetical protein ACW4YW_14960 [Methylobacillus pratensis]
MTWLLMVLKMVGGRLAALLKLALEHWQITLCLVAAFYFAVAYTGLKAERNAAIGALAKLTQSIQEETKERLLENAALERDDIERREESALAITDTIERIKAYYANQTQTRQPAAGLPIAGLRNSTQAGSGDGRVPGISISLQGLPESWPDTEPAPLGQSDEEACAITTAYYNGLMADWIAACEASPGRCR